MKYTFTLQALEVIAFITSIYYYRKDRTKYTLYLVLFLGLTVFSECFGWYAYFVKEGSFLYFLEGTPFEKNYWYFNIYLIISMLFYIHYFKWYYQSKKNIKLINMLSILFLVGSITYLFFTPIFFIGFSPFTMIVGTLFVFLSVALYYLELLNSNRILKIHKTLPFYVSVAALIWHLCVTPFMIYSYYFSNSLDPEFVKLYIIVVNSTNILTYSIYIAGFLICSRERDLY
ncbi:hypothetical protein [Ulvibacter litoralis]|uniref:Histidine kinase N-terminal 7TM region domain-containing protein n=1 Tax=Ulvibacter litoralis TaxID=227084 RepID=A0A1G7HIL0_9FLAO|nr:hypothetical protein [Ulvibacter litoralis]GHC57977.1 hypothetical protein GCM10008083_23280 [Ulvibacter litoralis]SDF00322.1 hypothetical protein SAMN05421855_104118 [Ulvibacter litoralis]